jgi:naphthalene 1,2-dioxygenase ferredoxin component
MTATTRWHPTVPATTVAPDAPVRAQVGNHRLVLYQAEGGYYATAEFCTHARASLADGYQEGFRIECPLHQGVFDVRTGAAIGPPCTIAIRSYPVRVSDGILMIGLPSDELDP